MKEEITDQALVVRKELLINADPHEVWDAITKPEITKQYFFGCEVHSNWHKGSTISYTDAHGDEIVKGEVLQIIPMRLLVISAWGPSSGLEDVPSNYSQVRYELISENDKAKLFLHEDHFGDDPGAEKRYLQSEQAWDKALMALKILVEKTSKKLP